MKSTNEKTALVDGVGLLKTLFEERSRPSLRWLRTQQKRKALPYIKLGRLVYFDPSQVREALTRLAMQPRGVKAGR